MQSTPPNNTQHFAQSLRGLLCIWLALLALLGATLLVMLLPLKSLHPALNLGIAALKTLCIALVFMHLNRSSVLVRLIAVSGLFWMMILMGLSFNDYWTRPLLPL